MEHPVIVIVGCGFIGSHLAEEMAKLCFSQDIFPYHFVFVDFDTWEERNAANQNVGVAEAKAGGFKADTCVRYIEEYGQHNTATAINERLTSENMHEILSGAHLIIDCVDNIPTRQIMWAFGKGSGVPVMHTGISRSGQGIVNWSSKNFDTFPFNPNNIAGRELQEQDIHEPPCRMYKYREAGVVLVQAIAKSASFFFGRDPWDTIGKLVEKDMMTCWNTTPSEGAILQIEGCLVDNLFPIVQR